MDKKTHYLITNWCDTATNKIIDKSTRKKVKRELYDHMEDSVIGNMELLKLSQYEV